MTTWVEMYHPALPGTPHIRSAAQAVAENAARGWLVVDGSTPPPEDIYLTPGVGDLRYAKVNDIPNRATTTGAALGAAFVPFWTAAEAVTSTTVRMAPDGHAILSNSSRTTRGSYDATEQGNWTVVGGGLSGQPLQQIAATVSASGALVSNKHNPVNAAGGAKAMTLPTGQSEGSTISVEKTDASTNAVTVTGNIRGVGSTSIDLVWQNEDLVLRADSAGSWWPVSGHKTKAALDTAYNAMAKHARPAIVITDPGRLSWRPPTLVNPTIVDVPTGFYAGTFGAAEDVILELPASSRTSTISVTGGRNVVVIGGTTLLNSGTSGSSIMRFQSVSGHVYIEGISLDANIAAATANHHDAIDAYGDTAGPFNNAPDVTIQNCRIVGVNGTSATNHADVYQVQGAVGRLRIDKLTGRSNYQGLFMPPQFPIASRDLRRIDLGYEAGGDPVTYLVWLQDAGTSQSAVRTSISDVYATPRSGQTLTSHAVFPSVGQVDASSNPIGALTFDTDASAYWPDIITATGSVKKGPPASGDYVPAGTAGFGYVSPGYLDETPFTYRSSVLADTPALYLPLDGNSSDVSGAGLNGTDTAITYTATGGGARRQGAGFASGSSSKISVPDVAALRLSSTSFSIEFWTLLGANVTGSPGVIKKGATDAATTGWQVFLAAGSPGTPVFKRNALSAQPPTNSMVLNRWQHWVFRFNAASSTWVWYLDGAKVASGTQAGYNLANTDTTALELGHGDSAFLTATLDEVAVYTGVLTTDRIQAHRRGL